MVCAPGDESPVRAVPQAADEENYQRVAEYLPFRAAATSEWDVDIIPEPAGEAYVPSSPELGNVPAEIRIPEVLRESDSEELRSTDSHIGVAGEVSVYLERVQDGGKEKRASCLRRVAGPYLVHIHGAVVRDHDFLEKAPEHLSQAVNSLYIFKDSLLPVLRQKVCGTADWSCKQLWEEADEGRELDDILCRLKFASVNIYRVAEGLEGVEADSDREDDVQKEFVSAQARDEGGEGTCEEVVVLEDGQNCKVQDYDCGAEGFRLAVCIAQRVCILSTSLWH